MTITRHKILDENFYTPELLKSLLMNALFEGDFETLEDVLVTQIRLSKKADLVRKSKLGRQTLYDLTEGKREFNPTIRTLSALLQALAA